MEQNAANRPGSCSPATFTDTIFNSSFILVSLAATDAELTSTPYLKSQPLHIYLLRAGSTIAELISKVSVPGARAEGIVLGAPGQGCVGAPGAVYARTEN